MHGTRRMTWIGRCAAAIMVAAPLALTPPAGAVGLEPVVALDTEGGAARLSAEAGDFLRLSMYFATQRNTAFCGPATIAMILNASGLERPADMRPGRGLFDQDNIFTVRMSAIKTPAVIDRHGMSLAELGAAFAAHDLPVVVRHAAQSDLDTFRAEARAALDDAERFVAVNYLRRAIGQQGGGHISPLAAYDEATDSFLILDVARYRYPPVWVDAATLFAAMDTTVAGSSRGWVVTGGGAAG